MNNKSIVILGAGVNDMVETDAIRSNRAVYFVGVT